MIPFYFKAMARPAGDLMIRDFYVPDATLSIVFDPLADEYRVILMSCCTSMCVSMKYKSSTTRLCILSCSWTIVPSSSFLSALRNDGINSAIEHPAYFVRVGWDITNVIEQSIRFSLLLPADEYSTSLLQQASCSGDVP